jgi:glycine/D-amino acid oxidase-like deaminating enzyme
MPDGSADVVICGAGIAGISAAYHLAIQQGVKDVVLVDELPPLSLTSDKSTECYRNWWPGPGDAMVGLMNRSIDILEEIARATDNRINLNRRGYLFATADPARIKDFRQAAQEAASLGAGPVRVYSGQPGDPPYAPAPAHGFEDQPTGSDLILDQKLIREHFAYLPEETIAVVHPRRCGWFSAQQLGMYMLERARERGVKLLQARVEAVDVVGGQVRAVHLQSQEGGKTIATRRFVVAAGPLIRIVGKMIGVELPVYFEFHAKVAFSDHLGVVRRDAPLLIWTDPQCLPWTEDVHARPEGPADSPIVLILWTYHVEPVEPVLPPVYDPYYPEIALRGLMTLIPDLKAYIGRIPKLVVDGGYYAKTQENRPLIGPLPVKGAHVIGALSGFGLMASPAAGELLAAHVTGSVLPRYAPAFALERYQNPEYQKLLENWGSTGQL